MDLRVHKDVQTKEGEAAFPRKRVAHRVQVGSSHGHFGKNVEHASNVSAVRSLPR